MGLLVFMRNLLLALCLFLVLGFLYYSAWKLHLLRWEDSNSVVLSFDSVGHTIGSEYDKLGFLLNLDSKLPPELASKYANFSEGVCKPGYASALMTVIFPKYNSRVCFIVMDSFEIFKSLILQPRGDRGAVNLIHSMTSQDIKMKTIAAEHVLGCRENFCLLGAQLARSVSASRGRRLCGVSEVSNLQHNKIPQKSFLESIAAPLLKLLYFIYNSVCCFVFPFYFCFCFCFCYQSASDGFWKSVATRVPREPHEIRILNPYFIQEAAFSFIGLPFNNGLMGRGNIPTLGSVAITMALHNCDEVAVAGFGYDMSSPNAPLHYYENIKMSAIKESWTHNIQREKEFLRKLVRARVITDLTSGI
ncbi:SIAT6 sialyltransferase, partial [Sitta europaea]|nr:SIAT6 sialyltransferase [Sitta europaea]